MYNETFLGVEYQASWEVIREMFKLDSRKDVSARALPKITPAHVNPNNWEKMRVKLATQVFSRSFYAAIMTVYDTGELKSISPAVVFGTAILLREFNDYFDVMNSSSIFHPSETQRAMKTTDNKIVSRLEELNKFFGTIKVPKAKRRSQVFDGVKQTTTAAIELLRELPQEYLCTNRLNSDPIENFFSVVRSSGGDNTNPSCRSFREIMSNCMTAKLKYVGMYINYYYMQHDFIIYLKILFLSYLILFVTKIEV